MFWTIVFAVVVALCLFRFLESIMDLLFNFSDKPQKSWLDQAGQEVQKYMAKHPLIR